MEEENDNYHEPEATSGGSSEEEEKEGEEDEEDEEDEEGEDSIVSTWLLLGADHTRN